MGEFIFENQTLGSFLVYHLDQPEQLDQLAVGMLTHNHIPGILPANCMQVDAERIVRFRISSLTALMGYWGGAISRQKLLTFLDSFCKAILECQEYMLDPGHILLACDQVFVEPLSGEVRLAYLPVLNPTVEQLAPERFLRDLLQHTTFTPDEDSGHVPVLLNTVNTPNFSVESLHDRIKALVAEPKHSTAKIQPAQSVRPVQPVQPVRPVAPIQSAGEPMRKKMFSFSGKAEKTPLQPKGATAVLKFSPPGGQDAGGRPVQPVRPVQSSLDGGGTVLLSNDTAHTVSIEMLEESCAQVEKAVATLCIVRRLTGERVVINRPIFHVGRESRIVDFCLSGGHAWVGTDHAYFLKKPDGIYLVDNNSLNHTWLNGQRLVSNQLYLVKPGDIIKMADEEFDVLSG